MMRLLATSFLAVALLCVAPAAAPAAAGDFGAELGLLKTRVTTLGSEIPAGRFPVATDPNGQLHTASGSDWNSGFWSGALWRLFDLTGDSADSTRALRATVDHFGFERTKLHDLGFMYGESSVAAYERLCERSATPGAPCTKLKASGLRAARTLLELSRTTGQRIIPMSARTCSDCRRGATETIIDSMMNLPLLYWATRVSGNRNYRALAKRHAAWVDAHLVRSDFSTYQSGSYSRRAAKPRILRHTHQGRSNRSVWSRGQAWSIYGFALAGREFRDKGFIETAERGAEYVARYLPADGVPPWDYKTGAAAPKDVSAGVITAAGLFQLADVCRAIKNSCASAERWEPLGRRMLAASLAGIRTTAPIGYLGGMVYKMSGTRPFDRDAELTLGLNYALEAIALARR